MSKTRFECRQVIFKNWTQMTPGSETLTYKCLEHLFWGDQEVESILSVTQKWCRTV